MRLAEFVCKLHSLAIAFFLSSMDVHVTSAALCLDSRDAPPDGVPHSSASQSVTCSAQCSIEIFVHLRLSHTCASFFLPSGHALFASSNSFMTMCEKIFRWCSQLER